MFEQSFLQRLLATHLDSSGKILDLKRVGGALDLPQSGSDTRNAAGQTIRKVRDASGAILELTLDSAGKVVNSRVVSGATGRQ